MLKEPVEVKLSFKHFRTSETTSLEEDKKRVEKGGCSIHLQPEEVTYRVDSGHT